MNVRIPAVRLGLLPAGIALALAPSFASAQDAAAGTTDLDRISVTGSRIRQASMETAQPVIALQRADIEKQGFTNVADIVQNLAATGSPAISRADALTSGEEVGGQYVDLRNLGPERTLVLLDGKRMGTSTGGYTDLASIPTSVVERIEVLTDGASAIYGSDAIAGVINIITRKNFDGLEASFYRGQYGEGDGEQETYNFVYGQTGERGSLTLGAEYSKQDEVKAKDRRYSRYGNGQWHPFPNEAEGANGWSAASNKGVLIDPNDDDLWYVRNPGAAGTSLSDFHDFGLSDYTNASEEMWLQNKLERRSVFANGNYDINDNGQPDEIVTGSTSRDVCRSSGSPVRAQAQRFSPTPPIRMPCLRPTMPMPSGCCRLFAAPTGSTPNPRRFRKSPWSAWAISRWAGCSRRRSARFASMAPRSVGPLPNWPWIPPSHGASISASSLF